MSSCNCVGCVYQRYPKIPPSPIKRTKLAVVGEAPGIVEIARKTPFVGPSGELIRRTFKQVGLPDPSEAFVTNALLCRPPKGQISKDAVVRCRTRLVEELCRVEPEMIIAFGNTAVAALMNDFKLKITRIQGRVFESEALPFKCFIVPVVHPASVLRAGGMYNAFAHALRKAYEVYTNKASQRPPDPTFTVIENGAMLERAIKGLVKQPLLGGDIETHGNPRTGRIIDFGVCWNQPKGTGQEVGRVLIFPEDMIPYVKPLLEHPYPKWIWHGGKYDIEWWWQRGIQARLDHDTMMLHYALVEQTGTHGLDYLSVFYLGDEPYKKVVRDYNKGKKKEGYGDVPKDILWPYLAKDADRMVRLFHILYPQVMADPDLAKLYYELLLPANRFLAKVQARGLLVNFEKLNEEDERLQTEINALQKEVIELAAPYWDPDEYLAQTNMKSVTAQFKPSSPYQLAWLLFDRLGLNPKYKKGRSTREEVLEQLKGQHPIVDKILELRGVQKLYSTYIKGTRKYIEEDDRVHTGFKVHGTVTGRLSSSEPNVQNIPKKIRHIYKAPPGYVLIDADYSGAELRVLAYVSGDTELIRTFKEGRSLHKEVAKEFFGENYTDEQYMRAKAVNFGIAYGRKAFSLAVEMDISQAEAQDYIDKWYAKFPQAHRYLLQCDAAAERGEVLVTDLGRKRRFGLVTQMNVDDLQNEARNFRIQSLASDMTLISAMRMDSRLEQLGARIVNLIHDSIVIECPEAKVPEVVAIANEVMISTPKEVLKTDIPFVVEFKVGKVWGKEMEDYVLP